MSIERDVSIEEAKGFLNKFLNNSRDKVDLEIFEDMNKNVLKGIESFFSNFLDERTYPFALNFIKSYRLVIYVPDITKSSLEYISEVHFDPNERRIALIMNNFLNFFYDELLGEENLYIKFQLKKSDDQMKFNKFLLYSIQYIEQQKKVSKIPEINDKLGKDIMYNRFTKYNTQIGNLLPIQTNYKTNDSITVIYNIEPFQSYNKIQLKCPVCGVSLDFDKENKSELIKLRPRSKNIYDLNCNHKGKYDLNIIQDVTAFNLEDHRKKILLYTDDVDFILTNFKYFSHRIEKKFNQFIENKKLDETKSN